MHAQTRHPASDWPSPGQSWSAFSGRPSLATLGGQTDGTRRSPVTGATFNTAARPTMLPPPTRPTSPTETPASCRRTFRSIRPSAVHRKPNHPRMIGAARDDPWLGLPAHLAGPASERRLDRHAARMSRRAVAREHHENRDALSTGASSTREPTRGSSPRSYGLAATSVGLGRLTRGPFDRLEHRGPSPGLCAPASCPCRRRALRSIEKPAASSFEEPTDCNEGRAL